MYEKQGTPPCGALNSYIWNNCIGEIADAIEDIALLRVEELHLLDSRGDSAEQLHRGISKEQLACAELRSIRLERTPIIAVDKDTVYFSSEIFCEFQLHAIGGVPDEEKGKFLWTSCKLTLLPAGHRLEVLQVNPMVDGEYMREPLYPLPEFPGVSANQNLLPDLSGMYDASHKESLEKEAKRFLTQYCREALEQPQVVPIRQIGEEKMGINLIVDKSLSDDLSIFGETVFVDSDVGVLTDGEPEQLHCKAGTILLDPDVLMMRNMGSYNFTLAHEVYHWYAHRAYMLLRMANAGQGHAKQESAVQQCYVYNNGSSRTPAALAEIQADAVAARILMPRRAVARKYKKLQEKYGTAEEMMVSDLAIFFEVSKQAMRIRLEELGIMVNTVPQPEKLRRIDRLTLFDTFSTDKNLRRLLVSGAYRYADGYIVKNEPQYVENETLTECAIEHLGECTLEFKSERHQSTAADALLQRYEDYDLIACSEGAVEEDDLKQKELQFERFLVEEANDDLAPPEKTFCEMLTPYLKQFRTGDDFEIKTGVHRVKLKQFRDGKLNNPEVRTVVAICAGLDLDITETMEMLRSAGYILLNTREHWAYKFIITCCEGMAIEERNAILIALGVRPLGSRKTEK